MLPEVLEIVADEIEVDKWKKFANNIGVKNVRKIDKESITTKEKIMKCFEEINDNITWKDLKVELQKIDRSDIITIIKNKTLLTIGKYLYFPSIIYII